MAVINWYNENNWQIRFLNNGKQVRQQKMKIYRREDGFIDFAERAADALLIVCDVNTAPLAADIEKILKKCGKKYDIFCFPDSHLVPEIERLKDVTEAAAGAEYILGVGSGVINDICKYVSVRSGKPYGILATAPSMDGYASGVSALYENGRKVTLPTTIPSDILIDAEVLANAPLDMIVAGAGDLIGKNTSLLDWKLAHLLRGEKYDPAIVGRMKKALTLGMSSAELLCSRDRGAVKDLIDGLILSGIEMQNAGNSRPASGSEHHISHYLEMAGEREGRDFAPHGVKVALGCLLSVSMYKAAAEKFEELEVLSDDIRALPSLRELETLYEKIGLPVRFGGIGVSAGLLSETIEKAWTVRDRYTIMTFLYEKGALGEFAARLSEKFA